MTEITIHKSLFGLKDVNIHIEDTGGDGRPIVLIHGWPLSGKSFKKQILILSTAGFRVITYDRRGFGESDKPVAGYDYDTLVSDLAELLERLDLQDVSLVGFSMGGGEVARYIATHGEERLRSVVFASAVTPMMIKTNDNPKGPLERSKADEMSQYLSVDPISFYDKFTKDFFSAHADGSILVSEIERQEALDDCKKANIDAALATMESFATTDFRQDLTKVTVPTLVIHGDADGTVPFMGSGKRTHAAISHSMLSVIKGGPHGINVSHFEEFNTVLLDFLEKN